MKNKIDIECTICQNLRPLSCLIANFWLSSGYNPNCKLRTQLFSFLGTYTIDVAFAADSSTPSMSGATGGAPLTISGSGMDVETASVTICGNSCAIDAASTSYAVMCSIPAGTGVCSVEYTDASNS